MEAKKIIITGAATRIGAAIAKSLANFSIKILLHYNKSFVEVKKLKTSLEELGAEVFLIKADLNKTNETKKIVPYAYKMMKGIDCLINNASIFENDNIEPASEVLEERRSRGSRVLFFLLFIYLFLFFYCGITNRRG